MNWRKQVQLQLRPLSSRHFARSINFSMNDVHLLTASSLEGFGFAERRPAKTLTADGVVIMKVIPEMEVWYVILFSYENRIPCKTVDSGNNSPSLKADTLHLHAHCTHGHVGARRSYDRQQILKPMPFYEKIDLETYKDIRRKLFF